jgi:hypothetical protein
MQSKIKVLLLFLEYKESSNSTSSRWSIHTRYCPFYSTQGLSALYKVGFCHFNTVNPLTTVYNIRVGLLMSSLNDQSTPITMSHM